MISTESAWDTGQFAFASAASSWNVDSSMPGTVPTTVIADFVMPVPGTKVTTAETSSRSAGVSFLASMLEKAIEKHAECAPAISSSGLVLPLASSAREAHETG